MQPDQVVSPELRQQMVQLSEETRRQIGVFVDRKGHVSHVIVGDSHRIFLPDIGRHRAGKSRFRGLRLIHTHLHGESLSKDDLTDLSLLSLDMIVAIILQAQREPELEIAHLLPENPEKRLWNLLSRARSSELSLDFTTFIRHLEAEFQKRASQTAVRQGESAIVVYVDCGEYDREQELAELGELAQTCGVTVVDVVVQRRDRPDPKTVIGRGLFEDLILRSMQLGVDLLIFGRDLNPTQARNIADMTELRVIDRTQLILDIFAQRAQSRDGKLQVELAQLRYNLPRLMGRHTAMSRLTGGIGGRGPGETKLEIDRRRARDRITRLENEVEQLGQRRDIRRQKRLQREIPIVSLVGYTNAGKSTLLNTLTQSGVYVADQLFATLDPTNRRMRFPEEREVLITDTVGFIRRLPQALIAAFKATLEELKHADLLLHVVDISNPDFESHIECVDGLLSDLELGGIPQLRVLNKVDLIDADHTNVAALSQQLNGIAVSALQRPTLTPLMRTVEEHLWRNGAADAPRLVAEL